MPQNILLMDPNDLNRRLVMGLLGKENYTLTALSTPNDAGHSEKADLILADISLRNDLENTPTVAPVIYLADNESAPADIDSEFLLIRPIAPDVLKSRVASALKDSTPPAAVAPFSEKTADTAQTNEDYLRYVLDMCQELVATTEEAPFTALIVKNGRVLAEESDHVRRSGDMMEKAAIRAIRAACTKLNSPILTKCEIYLSTEPCPMSLAAIYEAGLDRVYYANRLEDIDGLAFDYLDLYEQMARHPNGTMPIIEMLTNEGRVALDDRAAQR